MAHVPHLLLPPPWADPLIGVPATARHHLEQVLRRTSTGVTYTDGVGTMGTGVYEAGAVRRGAEREVARLRPVVVAAVAAPAVSDRQRFVVEKLAELGVDELAWLSTAYGGHKIPSAGKARSWAVSALQQSRGAWLMEISGPGRLDEIAALGEVVIADVGGPPLSLSGKASGVVVFAVGPEGGFAAEDLGASDARRFGLGRRTLRVETAAVVAAALVLERVGRLGGGGGVGDEVAEQP